MIIRIIISSISISISIGISISIIIISSSSSGSSSSSSSSTIIIIIIFSIIIIYVLLWLLLVLLWGLLLAVVVVVLFSLLWLLLARPRLFAVPQTNSFQTTLTPNPENIYKCHSVAKQAETRFRTCSSNAFELRCRWFDNRSFHQAYHTSTCGRGRFTENYAQSPLLTLWTFEGLTPA